MPRRPWVRWAPALGLALAVSASAPTASPGDDAVAGPGTVAASADTVAASTDAVAAGPDIVDSSADTVAAGPDTTAAGERTQAVQAWDRAAAPGPWHAFLATREGRWRLAGRIWNDPQDAPVAVKGDADLKLVFGGRFLQERLRGESAGVRYDGLGLLGCDNADSTVTFVWVDSAHTLTSVLRGRAGAPGQPLELRGATTDPATGRALRLRVVLTFVGPDEHRWDYFGAPEGWDEARLMELVYTRR